MSGRLSTHEKEKGTYFSVVTNDNECRNAIKQICLDFQFYAYIDHEPDDDDGSPHTHFMLRANGTRSIKQMADKLGIPANYIQVIRKVTSFRRYMLHVDQPEKKQYKLEDVFTNRPIDFQVALQGNTQKDVYSLFADYNKLLSGVLTPQEFIESNFIEIQSVSFSQKIKIFESITKAYNSHRTT